MAILASGAGISRIIGLLSIPVISRIYSPEHMGVLAVFTALVALLVPIGTLRYSVALPLPRSDRLAVNLSVLCMLLLGVMSLVITAILILFAKLILNLLNMQVLLPYWWLLIIAVIGTGFYEILSQWATREKAFKPLSKTQIWQSLIGAIIKVGLGLAGLKPLGLLIGQIVMQAGGILGLSLIFFKKFRVNLRYVTRKRIVFLLKRYADLPKYRLPSQFLLVFSAQSPLLFSAWLFDAETTGQLGLALMALALPITLFGQTTGQAYYAEIAKIGKNNPRKIYQITKKVTAKLFIFSIIPFFILLFFGPLLFEFLFGSKWQEAGIFARILSIYLIAQFISAPIINVFTVFDKEKTLLSINLRRFILIIAIFIFSRLLNSTAIESIGLYSIILTIHYLLVIKSTFKILYYV